MHGEDYRDGAKFDMHHDLAPIHVKGDDEPEHVPGEAQNAREMVRSAGHLGLPRANCDGICIGRTRAARVFDRFQFHRNRPAGSRDGRLI